MTLECWILCILLLCRYLKYNGKLRDLLSKAAPLIEKLTKKTPEKVRQVMEQAAREIGNDYTTTVLTLVSAIVKVRTCSPLPPSKKVPTPYTLDLQELSSFQQCRRRTVELLSFYHQ